MGRPAKARYWPERDVWFTRIGGKYQVLARGKRNRAEATKALHKILVAEKPQEAGGITVAELFDRLLLWVADNLKPVTLDGYRRHLERFSAHVGYKTVAGTLRPYHVTDWLDTTKWNRTTRHGAITAVKRAFSFGKKQGLLESNPMESLERPGANRRQSILTPTEEADVLRVASAPLRDYLTMIHETGCRPSEVAEMEAKHLVGRVIVREGKTTRATKRKRSIYLTDRALALVQACAEKYPEGPLFRNRNGKPWTRNATTQAMKFCRLRILRERNPELRSKPGPNRAGRESKEERAARRKALVELAKKWKGCTAESFRHGWITEAKMRLPNSVVAELAGHTSTAMIDSHYNHVSERHAELSAAALVVRGSSAHTEPVSPVPEVESAES